MGVLSVTINNRVFFSVIDSILQMILDAIVHLVLAIKTSLAYERLKTIFQINIKILP